MPDVFAQGLLRDASGALIVAGPGGTPIGGATPTWTSVANLNTGVTPLGAPFRTACECAMVGTTLAFRGDLAIDGGASSGFRLFDLPVAIATPAFQVRLMVQTSPTSMIGLNLNTDRTVTLAANSGTFVILDGCSIAGWTS